MDRREISFGLLIAVLLALTLSPFASQWPDGLEKVAEDKGFIEKGEVESSFVSPIPDYAWPGIKNKKLATSIAGVFGTILLFGMGCGLAKLLKRNVY
ncbi:MAG: hypothetical protein A2Z72_03185 [Omnitrophica bacterium RBG_13_46_9]|nr:MAG: hypothetical protein A2Z72_03185 [Omnitrophica bacterium RBG_13_46_9]